MKIYNIFYTDACGHKSYVATTNNLEQWLMENNKDRDEAELEELRDFEIKEADFFNYK